MRKTSQDGTRRKPPFYPIMKMYWFVWGGAVILCMLVPATAASGSWFGAGCLSIGYVAWSSIVALTFSKRVERPADYDPLEQPPDLKSLRRVILIGVSLALFGIFLIALDRIYFQNIDYTESLASARYKWQMAGELRQGGISSVYSALGNLLWPFSYVSLILILIRWEQFQARFAWPVAVGSLVAIVVMSMLNGGRAPLLIVLGAVGAVVCIRMSFGLRKLPRVSEKVRLAMWGSATLFTLYFPFILAERARVTNIESRFYTFENVSLMQGKVTDSFQLVDRLAGMFGDFIYLFVMNIIQLIHPFWVLEAVMFHPDRQGSVILTQLYYLQKLSLFTNINLDWDYTGLFISLPGAVYYDLGVWGLLLAGIIHGLALAKCNNSLAQGHLTSKQLVFLVIVFITTILSPLIASFLLGAFVFMVGALVVLVGRKKISI